MPRGCPGAVGRNVPVTPCAMTFQSLTASARATDGARSAIAATTQAQTDRPCPPSRVIAFTSKPPEWMRWTLRSPVSADYGGGWHVVGGLASRSHEVLDRDGARRSTGGGGP